MEDTRHDARQGWPGSRLEIVETEGHGGEIEMELTIEAIDGFARVLQRTSRAALEVAAADIPRARQPAFSS